MQLPISIYYFQDNQGIVLSKNVLHYLYYLLHYMYYLLISNNLIILVGDFIYVAMNKEFKVIVRKKYIPITFYYHTKRV